MITKQITPLKFFSIDDAINSTMNTKTVFIIANERKKKSGDIGRYYTIFSTFKDFLSTREKYPHCHENLLDHINNKPNLAGRLVFDFDIKDIDAVPDDFKEQIEWTIEKVIAKYFTGVDLRLFEYVWSTSLNPEKLSKHLTVKNLHFNNWFNMSKIFYKLFWKIWEKKYDWIQADKLIDFQIIKKRASLRMVGSSKIGGHILEFDSDKYTLTDSLIRIYFKNQRESEQFVTRDNLTIDESDCEMLSDCVFDTDSDKINTFRVGPVEQLDPVYDLNVYKSAFEMYNELHPNIFKMGKINGKKMILMRNKPYNCLLSNKYHENQNAFINIHSDSSVYNIWFGCFQYCHKSKAVLIGSITINSLLKMPHPNFEKFKEKKKPKKKKFDPSTIYII